MPAGERVFRSIFFQLADLFLHACQRIVHQRHSCSRLLIRSVSFCFSINAARPGLLYLSAVPVRLFPAIQLPRRRLFNTASQLFLFCQRTREVERTSTSVSSISWIIRRTSSVDLPLSLTER